MRQVRDYWSKVASRAWRRSRELVRLESRERVVVFLIFLFVPAVVAWFLVGEDMATTLRVIASLCASVIALVLMFVLNLLKLPAVMDAEAEEERKKLADQQETTEKRRRKQDRLDGFLARGNALMIAALDYAQPPPANEAKEWLGELIEYLEAEFGAAYVARVNDGGTAPVGYCDPAHAENHKIYDGIRVRVYHLQEFLKELSR